MIHEVSEDKQAHTQWVIPVNLQSTKHLAQFLLKRRARHDGISLKTQTMGDGEVETMRS